MQDVHTSMSTKQNMTRTIIIAITIIIIILIIIAAISLIMYLEKDLFSMNNILHVNYYLLYYLLKYP